MKSSFRRKYYKNTSHLGIAKKNVTFYIVFHFFFYIFILPLVDLFAYFLFIINSIIKVKLLSFLSFTQSPYYLVHSNFIGKKTFMPNVINSLFFCKEIICMFAADKKKQVK